MGQKHSRATLRLYPAKRTQHQWLQRAQHLAHEAILRNLCGQRKTVRTAYRIALDPQPQNNDPKISRRARILPAALQPKTIAIAELPQNPKGIFKDSYVFEFLDLPVPHKEQDLQQALVASLKDFILELGTGFTFIGQEYRLQIGNDDFAVDLLFFHRHLQCLVAFEIKNRKFQPADLGQLEFYLEALDQTAKLPDENPSIGVLLCREKDDEVVRLALNRTLSPTVIAEYETKLIPKELLRQKINEFYELLEGVNLFPGD